MNEEDKRFVDNYEKLLNKGYCNCNEMNCIDNNSPRRILNIVKQLEHNWNELKKYIEDEIEKIEHTIRQEQLGILTTPRLRNIQMEEVPYKKMLSKMQKLEEGENNDC